jgi:hypothetical protein
MYYKISEVAKENNFDTVKFLNFSFKKFNQFLKFFGGHLAFITEDSKRAAVISYKMNLNNEKF